jgi:glycosyltransferase involved in cell wall biosynthesis
VTRQRILVITDDSVGAQMAGPAIRAWNIADILADDHDVRLASTRRAEGSNQRFLICDGSGGMLPGLAKGMDIIVVQGFTMRANPWLADSDARIVVDLYDPVHLEILEGARGNPPAVRSRELAGSLEALRVQMERGDFFLCASPRQRDLWLGHLAAIGRVNFETYEHDADLRTLIDVAPFGTDPGPALPAGRTGAIKGVIEGIDHGDTVLLWAGGVYNWFDPVTLVDAVGDLVEEFPRLRLLFMGTRHPSLDDLSTTVLRQAIDRAAGRGLLGTHVFFREGWVPYRERGRFLADADIGVSTHLLHVETAYSFRTRMLDYMWAGLPIVCTEGDEFAALVDREGLGRVVRERDRAALAEALRELVGDADELAMCRDRVPAVAAGFAWPTVLAPLVAYCADPWRAADGALRTRPVGAAARLGSRIDDRTAWVREYVAANGIGRFVRMGLLRSAQRLARLLRGPRNGGR